MFNIRMGIPEMEALWGKITIIGPEPHPEDKKSDGYKKVCLSELG